MYNHIKDCWADIKEAKTIEEVKNLFRNFPRWSGDWEVEVVDDGDEKYYVVLNRYWDHLTESQEEDFETLDIPVEAEDLE